MPRVYDRTPRAQDDKNPLKNLLNYDAIDAAASNAGSIIQLFLEQGLGGVFQLLQDATGLDFSSPEAFVASLIGIVTVGGPAADWAASLLSILGVGAGDLPNTVDGFFALLNSIFGGLTGSPTGGQQTPSTVGGAVGSLTSTIAALAAAVNRLEQQNLATSTSTSLAMDSFTRAGADLGADWDVEIFNTFASGYVKTDGSQAVYIPSGFGTTAVLARFRGTNHTAASDTTSTVVVLGTPLSSQVGVPTAVDIHGRMSADRATSVRARLLTQGFSNILQLHSRVSGVETLIGTADLGAQPGVGTIAKLQCGTNINARQFLVILNNQIYPFTETGTTSQLGAGFRERGMGWFSGGSFFGQGQAGAVAHWTSIDVGAAGGSTPVTADTVDGGSAAAPSVDIYDGGSAATPATDIIDGGSA